MEESWFLSILDNISTDREKTTKEKQLLDQVFGIDLICQSICQLVPHKALQTLRKTNFRLLQFVDISIRLRSEQMLSKKGIDKKMGLEKALYQFSTSSLTNRSPVTPPPLRPLGLSPRSFQKYSKKLRQLISNVTVIKQKILNKEKGFDDPAKIVRLTALEMASNKKKKERKSIKQASTAGRLLTSKQRLSRKGMVSDRFICGACNSNVCTYKNRQSNANSKDANNIVVHCTQCSHWWMHYGLFPAKKRRKCT